MLWNTEHCLQRAVQRLLHTRHRHRHRHHPPPPPGYRAVVTETFVVVIKDAMSINKPAGLSV